MGVSKTPKGLQFSILAWFSKLFYFSKKLKKYFESKQEIGHKAAFVLLFRWLCV